MRKRTIYQDLESALRPMGRYEDVVENWEVLCEYILYWKILGRELAEDIARVQGEDVDLGEKNNVDMARRIYSL
jgi:hypothetical protein